MGARAAGPRPGRAEPPRARARAALRARHLDVEPRHHRRHARQQLRRLALDRLRPHRRARDRDHRRSSPTAAGSCSARSRPPSSRPRCARPALEGQIYREVARIRDQYATRSALRYPKHWRRVCGYNLDELVKDRPLNMARLIVGSEGTLLTVVEAKMRLVRRPTATARRRHPLPRHAGGARVLAGHPRDGPLRGRADRQDDPRPRAEQHRAVEAHGLRAGRSRPPS